MKRLNKFAAKIDAAAEAGDTCRLTELIAEVDKLLDEDQNDSLLLNYFRANAFSAKCKSCPKFETRQFEWVQPELTQEIISLRRAAHNKGFKELSELRRCQILTNLGNALDTFGRPIDALAAWDSARSILPNFAMAHANKANGLVAYIGAFYDRSHQWIFLLRRGRNTMRLCPITHFLTVITQKIFK